MKLNQVKKIMQKYKKAWEKQSTSTLLECFTKTGIYQESPLAKPYKGHKEIAKFWKDVVIKNTKQIKFKLKKCYVSENNTTGFAEWECVNYQKAKYSEKMQRHYTNKWQKCRMCGIMILKMKGDKISHLNEYWKTKLI